MGGYINYLFGAVYNDRKIRGTEKRVIETYIVQDMRIFRFKILEFSEDNLYNVDETG